MSNYICKVIVGSKLHGLDNENSDTDIRGIHISSLKDLLTPFRKTTDTIWIESEDEDSTSYELKYGAKLFTVGNPTALEILFSDMILQTTPIADEMRDNWRKFMDTDRFVMASRGYAANQLNKMALFDDIGIKGQSRTPKFAVAYCRVLWQCKEFLETGQFPCVISDTELKAFLLEVKYNWSKELVPALTEKFAILQGQVSQAWASAEKMTPDIPYIEDFIYRAYVS